MRVLALLLILAGVARADDAQLAELTRGLPGCPADRAHCLAIRLHVTERADGPIAAAAWLATQLEAANRHFAPVGLGFTVTGVDGLPASAEHVATRRDRNRLASRLGGPVIHVFVIGQLDDVDAAGEVLRGVAWHVPGDPRKYVLLSTVAPARVLAHELGHVFGLPHSSYPNSIMNKTKRAEPPLDGRGLPPDGSAAEGQRGSIELRTFADEEVAAMRLELARLLRAKAFAELAK